MSNWNDHQLPEDLQNVVHRLRENRPEFSALELDQIKTRTQARARSSRQKGFVLKTRLTVGLLSLGLIAGGTGGVLAAKGGTPGPPSGNGGAGNSQYSNGKKCGQPDGGPKKPNQTPCPPASPAGGGKSK